MVHTCYVTHTNYFVGSRFAQPPKGSKPQTVATNLNMAEHTNYLSERLDILVRRNSIIRIYVL